MTLTSTISYSKLFYETLSYISQCKTGLICGKASVNVSVNSFIFLKQD